MESQINQINNSQCPEVLCETLPEGVRGQEVVHHPDDARALRVGYPMGEGFHI